MVLYVMGLCRKFLTEVRAYISLIAHVLGSKFLKSKIKKMDMKISLAYLATYILINHTAEVSYE